MEAEMELHIGYLKNSSAGDNTGNSRNDHTEKTVLSENQTLFPLTVSGSTILQSDSPGFASRIPMGRRKYKEKQFGALFQCVPTHPLR